MAATQQPLQMQLSSEEDLVRRLATAGCKGECTACWVTQHPASHVPLKVLHMMAQHMPLACCAVLEVYSSYAGPCKSVIPTYKKMRFEGKDEEVLGFLLIEGEACQQLDLVREHSGKSEPLFLVYRVRTHGSSSDCTLYGILCSVQPRAARLLRHCKADASCA